MLAWDLAMHLGLDGTLLKKRQWRLNSLLFPMSCSVTFKPGISQLSVCFSFAVNLMSLSVVLSAGNPYPLQSGVFISSSFSCLAFTLTGSHLFHWKSEQSVCSYLFPPLSQPFLLCSSVSAGVARSLLLSAIWVSHEAGSLPTSVFSLSTQLLALAYRHTVGTHASAAYKFRCRCQHSCFPCTVSAHTPTALPGYFL